MREGWELVRIKGSHHILKSPTGKTAVIPIHGGKIVHTGITNNLLKKHLNFSEEEIAKL
jgi:predicted RNA binding protein YcfA (HicA-like mRNA interferase family)